MPSIPTSILLLVTCVIVAVCATAGRERRQAATDKLSPLHHLLHRRSNNHQFLGPSLSKEFGPFIKSAMYEKRDGRNWVWVPSHGYVEIPSAEMSDDMDGGEGLGNLLRYGK
ncbi:uncharacterized protein LOC121386384 [Gigantopelta aegis]|uniref:uncharacterized protein LOC121386384 n=1 Tax=Gigantopelta aegis TaxID=1735272 RepID=UPI001B8880B1|nr:uncharacterized protein LOC121386384 [Gigantopelta aegis]